MQVKLIDPKLNEQLVEFEEILKNSTKTILYFYPKDNTPGCSLEAMDFTSKINEFTKHNIQVIGVSKDSLKSHCNFIEKKGLNISLISDENLELHNKFKTYGEKNNYGKITMGTIRSTFLLDDKGNILKEYRGVKATGHVERLIKEIL